MDQLSSAREGVMALVSDDHNAEAGEAALRWIIAGVDQSGGTEGLVDLAVALALKLADTVEQIAQDRGLLAADALDILFVDSPEVIALQPAFGHLLEPPAHQQEDPHGTH